jgi:hypothetical protein
VTTPTMQELNESSCMEAVGAFELISERRFFTERFKVGKR